MIRYTNFSRYSINKLNAMNLQFEKTYSNPHESEIHDLRITLRRTLTFLKFISFLYYDSKQCQTVNEYKKLLHTYLKSLSNLRDIQIAQNSLLTNFSDPNFTAPLIQYLKEKEAQNIEKLISEMDSWKLQKVRAKIKNILLTNPIEDKELELKIQLYINYLAQNLLQACQAGKPTHIETYHKIRITLKHYRYFLELLEQSFGIKQSLLKMCKTWQDQLGTVQDTSTLLILCKKRVDKNNTNINLLENKLIQLLDEIAETIETIAFQIKE